MRFPCPGPCTSFDMFVRAGMFDHILLIIERGVRTQRDKIFADLAVWYLSIGNAEKRHCRVCASGIYTDQTVEGLENSTAFLDIWNGDLLIRDIHLKIAVISHDSEMFDRLIDGGSQLSQFSKW